MRFEFLPLSVHLDNSLSNLAAVMSQTAFIYSPGVRK
jgi:hypothetical protein